MIDEHDVLTKDNCKKIKAEFENLSRPLKKKYKFQAIFHGVEDERSFNNGLYEFIFDKLVSIFNGTMDILFEENPNA